ncbi:hypothetical protein [Frankia sp. R43]|uniref:hypothetical protein n=1 Tax=Frankia sp. R43 TaxID=269536 RepID=UPI0006CA2C14|nr:hypothetical protein [Frankia sp. R43]
MGPDRLERTHLRSHIGNPGDCHAEAPKWAGAEQYRKAQLEFLAANATGEDIALPGVSPVALLVLMTMIARGFMMENSLGVTVGHAEALAAVEDILAAVENRSDPAGTRRDDEARTAGP